MNLASRRARCEVERGEANEGRGGGGGGAQGGFGQRASPCALPRPKLKHFQSPFPGRPARLYLAIWTQRMNFLYNAGRRRRQQVNKRTRGSAFEFHCDLKPPPPARRPAGTPGQCVCPLRRNINKPLEVLANESWPLDSSTAQTRKMPAAAPICLRARQIFTCALASLPASLLLGQAEAEAKAAR